MEQRCLGLCVCLWFTLIIEIRAAHNEGAVVGVHDDKWTYPSSLIWQPCNATYNVTDPAYDLLNNTDCANLSVPLDWNDVHNEERVTLVLNRFRSNGTAKERIGNLIINPGGPGSRGTFLVDRYANQTFSLSKSIHEKFDVIGLDPRGVGLSSPLKCNISLFDERVDLFPKTQAELDQLAAFHKKAGDSCRERGGHLVDFMDTGSVAEDLEAYRRALGGEKLNFLGVSCGTVIGVKYAERYPKNIRAMVLDSVVDNSLSPALKVTTSAVAFDRILDRFFDWCRYSSNCTWHDKDAPRLFDEVVHKAVKKPLPAPDCKGNSGLCVTGDCKQEEGSCYTEVTISELLSAIGARIERRDTMNSSWQFLSESLESARTGNATAFSSGSFDPKTPLVQAASIWTSFATICQDQERVPTDINEVLHLQRMASALAPHTVGWGVNFQEAGILSCLGWPTKVNNRLREPFEIIDAPPMLLINSYWDMATTYPEAVNVHRRLKGSVLLSVTREGHTWYYNGGTEVAAAADEYLVSLKLPAANTEIYPSGF